MKPIKFQNIFNFILLFIFFNNFYAKNIPNMFKKLTFLLFNFIDKNKSYSDVIDFFILEKKSKHLHFLLVVLL